MADKTKNPFAEEALDHFDFDQIGKSEVHKPEDHGFGGDHGFEDDATNTEPFEHFGGEETFSAPGGDEDFFASGEDDFGGPPTPESVEMSSLHGDAHQEFGGLGDDGFGKDGDDDYSGVDPFSDEEADADGHQPDGHADPFSDEHVAEADDEIPAKPARAAAASSAGLLQNKNVQYAGGAVALAVVGYIGYAMVLPILFPPSDAPVVAQTQPAIGQSGSFPSTLPAMTASNDAPKNTAVAVVPKQPVATQTPPAAQTALPLDFGTTPATPVAVQTPPVVVAQPVATQPVAAQPVTQAPPAALAVQTPPPAVAVPVTVPVAAVKPVAADPSDDLVGGAGRGGIAEMKAAPPATVPSADIAALSLKIDDVARRLDAVEAKVVGLTGPVAGAVKATVPATAVRAPAASTGGVVAPLKPPIIEHVVLRGVSRDIGWISTKAGVVEVRVGDTVPDAGVVESFQNYRGQWIAVTDKGIILPR